MSNPTPKYKYIFRRALKKHGFDDADIIASRFAGRLTEMYASDAFKEHDIYPTINVELVYAVIAMCLELKECGLSDEEIIDFVNKSFEERKIIVAALGKILDRLPNIYRIVEKWNINDYRKRKKDGSITYEYFDLQDGKIEYKISGCMYVNMFEYYGIRNLCKIFCLTDINAYSRITRGVKFIRHSDLSDGDSCWDEIIDRRKKIAKK